LKHFHQRKRSARQPVVVPIEEGTRNLFF
jgi:hypothetical protein